jgi:myosin heavy subunit
MGMEYLFAAPLNRGRYLALECDQETASEIFSELTDLGLRIAQPRKFIVPAADGRRYKFKMDVLDDRSEDEVCSLIDDVVNQIEVLDDISEEVVRPIIDDVVNQHDSIRSLYVDREGYYSYVLLDGDQQWIQNVKSTLEGMNLRILRQGPSYRPAADGVQYSWYLRLERPINPEDENRIYDALRQEEYQEPIPARDIAHDLLELQAKLTSATNDIERAEKRKLELEQQFTNAREELNRTKRQLQRTQEKSLNHENLRQAYNKLESSFENSRIEINNLESEIKSLRRQDAQRHHGELPAETVEKYEYEISALRKINEKRETENRELLEQKSGILKDQQEYYDLLTEEEKRCRNLQTDVVNLEYEKSQLKTDLYNKKQRINQLTSERDLVQAAVNNAEPLNQSIYERMISLCLPKVEFVDRSSIPFLYNEVNDIDKVLRILTRLHYEKYPSLLRERVEGQSGWWETKFDTGPAQQNYGRIYYKYIGPKLKVLISEKDSQNHDIHRLPSD